MIKEIISNVLIRLRGFETLKSLKKQGLIIGENFSMQPGCIIDPSHCWLISIGDNVTLARNVYLLAHDASTKFALGFTKIGRISIGNNVFIGAGSIVMPNVRIGSNVIIGAGSIVTKDVSDNSVVIGVPAKVLCLYDEFIDKNKKLIDIAPVFDDTYTTRRKITKKMKYQMNEKLTNSIGFVE